MKTWQLQKKLGNQAALMCILMVSYFLQSSQIAVAVSSWISSIWNIVVLRTAFDKDIENWCHGFKNDGKIDSYLHDIMSGKI